MKIFVLVPAYNEEKNIGEIIRRIKKIGLAPLVIDDGSEDRTAEIAEKLNALVIRHEKNKGKGEAIKTGFNFLKNNPEAKYVVLIDADLAYLPEEAEKLIEPLKKGKADFVTGYRNWKEVPLRHTIGNFVWRTFFNLLFGTNFKDTNCGFMALTKNAIRKIKKIHGGYIIENALFIEALKKNLRIKQVPVSVTYKEKRNIASGLRMGLGVLIFIIIEGFKYRFGINY